MSDATVGEGAPPTDPLRDVPLDPELEDAVFDEDWYVREHPDVAEALLAPWEHFIRYGDAETRAPGPDFDPAFYARTYMPLEAEHPVHHYIVYGRPRGYLTRPASLSRADSALAMREALALKPHPILLIGGDAQEAGAPLLLLQVARHLRLRGYSPVFLIERGGPLLDAFRSRGPAFVAAEGWDLAGLGSALGPRVPVLANTGWGAKLLDQLQITGPSAVMVHEMVDYLEEHDLIAPLASTSAVIASMPAQRDALAARLAADATVRVVRPGLSSLPAARRADREIARLLEDRWGRGTRVFLSAGYADHRKGFDLFLDAARDIARADPRARFVWLGELSGWARALADAAVDEGMQLLLPGFRRDTAAWYAHTRVYLLTSRQDPGPTTVMDAARAGVPFVAYAADIGLRSLGDVLDGVGVFVDDRESFIREALEAADADTTAGRSARARHIARASSFGTYVDGLVDVLRENGPLDEPTPASRGLGTAMMRARPVVAGVRARLDGVTAAVSKRTGRPVLRGAYRPVVGPWMHDRPHDRDRSGPLVLAVVEGERVPGALHTPADLQALRPGDRAWIADVALLGDVRHPAVVHIARRTVASWGTIAAVEAAAPLIVELHQHSAGDEPRWFAERRMPPPARPARSRPTPLPRAITPRPAAGVRLARPIGVFLHAYYVEIAETLAAALARIDHPLRVYISTDDEQKAERLRALHPAADVRVLPNLGRDIHPKLFGFGDAYAHHDIVLHLHTKRSPHATGLAGWLDHIVDRLLPSTEGVSAILALFRDDPGIGMVSPTPFPGVGQSYGWGMTRPVAAALTHEHGWRLPSSRTLAFPAGSMFWARSEALAPIRAIAPPLEIFGAEARMLDGSVAHAFERLLGVSCTVAGYEQVFVERPARRTR